MYKRIIYEPENKLRIPGHGTAARQEALGKADAEPEPQVTTPGKDEKPTTASRPGDAPRRALLTQPDTPMDSGVKPGITPDTARGNPDMVTAKTETAPQIQPEAAPEAMPGTDSDIPNITADLRTEADVNTDADSAGTPVSYEDALRDYLGKGTEPSAALNTDADAESEISQEAVPKSKEQLISELAPKIQKPGITPGKATIAAEQMPLGS